MKPAAPRAEVAWMSAAGNVFAVWDARCPLPSGRRPDAWARELCAPRELAGSEPGLRAAVERGLVRPAGRSLDGLLLACPPRADGDCRMEIYNADGSRPEACGNGLRCVAHFAVERGLAASAARVSVETDAGTRRVDLEPLPAPVAPAAPGASGSLPPRSRMRARASMGRARVLGVEERLEVDAPAGSVRATCLELANPHCVVFVEDERACDVARLGPLLERHARFPRGTNVEFAAWRAGRWNVRVWERGVGETAACGTGACAVALAAAISGRARQRAARDAAQDVAGGTAGGTEIALPGGILRVGWEAGPAPLDALASAADASVGDAAWGEAWLEGPSILHAQAPWSPPAQVAAATATR